MREIWEDIPDYEGLYQASTSGRIRSIDRIVKRKDHLMLIKGVILKPAKDGRRGDFRVSLSKNNKTKSFLVSRLVAATFVNNTENKPDINHIDGNFRNNKPENLEWCTKSENLKHSFAIGLRTNNGESNPAAKLTNKEVKKIKRRFFRNISKKLNVEKIAKEFNVSAQTIYKIKSGKNWNKI